MDACEVSTDPIRIHASADLVWEVLTDLDNPIAPADIRRPA